MMGGKEISRIAGRHRQRQTSSNGKEESKFQEERKLRKGITNERTNKR